MPLFWQQRGLYAWLLFPLSLIFRALASLRRQCYRAGLCKAYQAPVPVLVVGNISVGGVGKTPLVIWLVQHLREQGWQPGIVSRGYGGQAQHWPQQVRPDSDPAAVGDEAVLLAQRAQCPVCVGPDRPAAIKALLQHADVDFVISDDGLQHYAMGRDLEIAVVDGERRFGNGFLLPAGPLREPVSRLQSVDLVIANGRGQRGEFSMQVAKTSLSSLAGKQWLPLSDFAGRRVRAIAGIGNPDRFFDLLKQAGLELETQAFPDHHAFSAEDLQFDDDLPLLMTEKDAVKCRRLTDREAWVLGISLQPDDVFIHRLDRALSKLKGAHDGQASA